MRIRGAVLEQIGRPRPYAESRPISVGELELAPPGDSELLVRIEAAGLCHSDLSVVDGNRVRPVPMLLGHEAAGIVEQAGSAVADMPVGQRIVMTFLPRCGHCPACATNGLTPCEPGSAANGAGTLMAGETAAVARRPTRQPPPRGLRLRHIRGRRPSLGGARARRRAACGGVAARMRRAHRRRGRHQRRPAAARPDRRGRGARRRRHGRGDHRAGAP